MWRCIAQLQIFYKKIKVLEKMAFLVSCHLSRLGNYVHFLAWLASSHSVILLPSLYNFICLLSDLSVDGCIPVWSEPCCAVTPDGKCISHQREAQNGGLGFHPRVDNILSQQEFDGHIAPQHHKIQSRWTGHLI